MSPFHNTDEGSTAESPQLDSLSLNMLGDLLKDLGQLGERENDHEHEANQVTDRPMAPSQPPPTTVQPRESSAGSGSSTETGVPVLSGGRWGAEINSDGGAATSRSDPQAQDPERVMANGEQDPNDDRPKGAPAVDLAKFRTKVCRNYSTGQPCQFGDRCAFAHGLYQVRSNLDPNPVLQVYGPQGKKKQQEARRQAHLVEQQQQTQQTQVQQAAQIQQIQAQLLRQTAVPLSGYQPSPTLPFSTAGVIAAAGAPPPPVGALPLSALAAANPDGKLFVDTSGCTWFV
eukprot:TRINITY_DN1417_c2_g1_i1.p1 TRINITY_DN1417_c2_g1~~TRINITY_DN1417_c2_g1_i1.p1  ORF type:complete len:298 (+),score=60.89 TRINITY_DN1417_c2_g1_i1:34-894(+)